MIGAAYTLDLPEKRTTSVVFASPHSGCEYARLFRGRSQLDDRVIRTSEDAFVDKLFDTAPSVGAPLLSAIAPRAFVDLNRAPDELDPALVEGAPRQRHNPRVASGLGVIPRVVAGGRAIYHGKLTMAEAQRRIGRWWRPYHDRLQRLLDESQYYFGEAILVDCHSMPNEAIAAVKRAGAPGADIVIGDRYGTASSPHIIERVEAAFAAQGFKVARNAPFAGAYIAQHYGRPSRNQHAVQIEVDRALYMDEARIAPRADFEDFRRAMAAAVVEIADIGRSEAALAAE